MDESTPPANAQSDLEIVSTRLFDAPRERVFDAFRDPSQLSRWWGPAGFSNRFEVFDLRPGGAWRFDMHGPDGAVYHIAKEFVEVVPPEWIVFKHISPMHNFVMTMVYADEAGRTRLTWKMRFESAEPPEIRAFIAHANEENFDRLAAHLASQVGA